MRRFFSREVIFLMFILLALNFINGGFSNPLDWFMNKLLLLPGIIIGVAFHEFAHGAVSYTLGDPTPKLQGRLTINPFAHIDPFGFLALLVAGFGWGIPVEVDPRYYKHRRRDEMLVSLAGVVMNFFIAVLFSFILKFLFMANPGWLSANVGSVLLDMLLSVISINLVLMVFNLIPVPPLDGFGILTELFDLRKYSWYYKVYDYGFPILLVLIIFGVTDNILTPCVNAVFNWLVNTIIF